MMPGEDISVINAAGMLTALGGSAQSQSVVAAQARAAASHVDLAKLRQLAGRKLAAITGAEAGCVTTGAAAGITISLAAILCSDDPGLVEMLPMLDSPRFVLLQAGHSINFGAPVTQMISLSGATPLIAGTRKKVTAADIELAVTPATVAFLYVKSHHCVQENMVELEQFEALARRFRKPLVVDAAAEEDLKAYINAGADLVTYSGGKAFGGPTSGFIVGRKHLVDLCEVQFRGIARTMKVGKEQIAGLLSALDEYTRQDFAARRQQLDEQNSVLIQALAGSGIYDARLKADEAGRPFSRVAISPRILGTRPAFEPTDLVRFLESGSPSIRTRNHQLAHGLILVDPRELDTRDIEIILERLRAFESST